MPDALDGDYSRSRAILVGTWDYRHLQPVPAAEHSLNRVAALLRGPLCGSWPSDRISVIGNRDTLGELPHQLVTSLRSVEDVALFYYVGHGQYDSDDRLCLTLADSRPDAALRTTTSLTFDAVRHAFRVSRASTKIAILDCCFAGLAAGPATTLAGPRTEHLPPSSGCYLMMASGHSPDTWCESGPSPQTYFSRHLVDVVETGIPGQPAGLTLGPIFQAVTTALAREGRPGPGSRVSDHAAGYVLARNAATPGVVHSDPAPPAPLPTPGPGPNARRRRTTAITALAAVATAAALLTADSGRWGRDPTAAGPDAVVAALPATLRRQVSCEAYSTAHPADLSCVIRAGDPVFGDLLQPGSGEYPFSAGLEPDPVWYAHEMRRSGGGRLLRTDPEVVLVDDSQPHYVGIDYLDPRTGLHLTLWNLASRQAARTFLTRSGLTSGGP